MEALGIDLGATNIKLARVDGGGAVLSRDSFPTDEGTAWRDRLGAQLASLNAQQPFDHLGICAPGLAAEDGRSISWMRGRLEGIRGLEWTSFLRWPSPIPVLNDGHAALLAEAWLGAAKGARHAILITLGTGVGGAILCDGKLFRGHIGRAGHLGHITVDFTGPPDIVRTAGSLEDAIGNHTVAARSEGRFSDTRDLVAAHVAGDPAATAVWLCSVRALAAALVSLINAVDPQVIVVGGGIASAGEALFVPLRRQMAEMEWRPHGHAVPVIPAMLGSFAGAIGAARAALLQIPQL